MGAFTQTLGTLGVGIVSSFDSKGFDAIDKGIADVDKALGDLEKDIDHFSTAATAQFEKIGSAGNIMAGVGAGLTAAFTLPLVGLGVASIDAAKDMDSLMRGLTAVAGSSEAATAQMGRLKEVAKLPGLGLEEAVQGSIRLQAVGTSALDAERYMKAFGNALATVGKGHADLDAVITQLVQMSSKTKVVAEDLKPVMERVPQVASILKQAFGTIDTKELSKAGLTTQQVVDTIITGLEKLPPVTGGIGNAFENLRDSSKSALVAIGNLLLPVIVKITPLIESFIAGVEKAAKWFGELPAPVQAAAGAFVLLVAAIGPVTAAVAAAVVAFASLSAALGGFGLTIGGVTAAMAPWALAIAAVTVALVALGVWVYQNWEPIVTVIKQAWEGVQEVWSSIWTSISGKLTGIWQSIAGAANSVWQPIANFFSTIWDSVSSYFASVWTKIGSVLTAIWNSIRSAATSAWDSITGALKTFISYVEKIPGVAKLLNLDETWASAKKTADALKDTAAQTKAIGTAAGAAVPKINLASDANDKAAKAAGKHAEAVRDAWDAAHKRAEDQAKESEKTRKWFEDAYQKLDQMNQQLAKSSEDLAIRFGAAHEQMRQAALKTVQIIVPESERIPQVIEDAIRANKDLESAYKTLGVTSADELNKHYAAAKAAYDLIKTSGTSSAHDVDAAWVAMERSRQAAAEAAGVNIPEEQRKMLEKMSAGLSTHKTTQEGVWGDMTRNVSTVFTNFAQDISKSLFDGDLSFGEKAKKMLSSLGQAVLSSFIEPATKAIGEFISGVLTRLMSGEGLGGVVDMVKNLGSGIGKIFGAGADVASGAGSAASGAAGAAGSAGSAASGAAGAVGSGLTGILGAAGGIVSAVSGVIGNFQMAGMNKTLDLIEAQVRFSQIHLKHILEDDLNIYLPKLKDINDWAWDVFTPSWTSHMTVTENIRDSLRWDGALCQRLDTIGFNTEWTMKYSDNAQLALGEIRDSLTQRSNNITINVNGADSPAATGSAVALKLQGAVI